ncbi:MAG: glycosyltransferase family 1 protein [Bacteroidia bacterium]|nr:glycosyltransferase family 1 protein [Bacteroidia bacterium]
MKNHRPHIAVNTRLLLPGKLEGISRFGFEILKRLVVAHPEVRFTFIFDRKYDPAYIVGDNIKPLVVPPPARHPLLWHAWFHLAVPQVLNALKPDVFFSPELYLTNHRTIPQIPVMHDIGFEHNPDEVGGWAARYLRKYAPRYARRAAHILTVSDFCREDIAVRYGIDRSKISIAYNAAHARFVPLPEAEKRKARETYTEGLPYFHFVGTIQPRKNIENLLQGFDLFKIRTGHPMKLLIVGKRGWNYHAAAKAYEAMEYRDDVIFTGFLPDEALGPVYAASQGLCLVSWLEGFGIPVVEAMHAGIPVICSNRTALPEIVGDAALKVRPDSAEEISDAMTLLTYNEGVRNDLIKKGLIQTEKFSWEESSDIVWNILARYLHGYSQ